MANSKQTSFYEATGRRKTAVARVRVTPRGENFIVNGISVSEYFPGKYAALLYMKPFKVTGTEGKFGVEVKVIGSGKYGQLGAMVHGISRALDLYDRESYHLPLKSSKLLTRDSRMKESKKVGLVGARRGKQSPKR